MSIRDWLCRYALACLLLAPGLAMGAPLAYVANGGSGTVSVIDTTSNTVVTSIPVGLGVLGVAVNATGTRVYVANIVLDVVSVIDTATNAVVATVPVGASPTGIAVNPAGTRVYVANADENTVSVVDTSTNKAVATVAVGAYPGGIVVNPAGTRVYVANSDGNSVTVIDATTNTVSTSVVVGAAPQTVAMNAAGTRLYVATDANSVVIIDPATNGIVGSIAVGAAPFGVAANLDGTRVYVANTNANSVSVIDTSTSTVISTVTVGNSPTGISVNPAGTRIYVANFESNNISVIESASNKVVATISVGSLPASLGQFIGPDLSAINNYQGLWWVPGGAESGWGINFAHAGDQVFATWYTYDTSGRAWWLSMLATRTTPTSNAYSGKIYVDSGPPFNNFVGTGVPTEVGSGTLIFADANNGSFAYVVNGVSQTKPIARYDLGTGPQPTCIYSSATPNFAAATNYQDLWWVANAVESGWGVNFTHQGDSLFATWYTYNFDHTPLWLSALVQRQGTSNVYTGPIYQNSGPRFDAYDTTRVVANRVGTATFTFADGNAASFLYSVMVAPFPGPVTQTKEITRFPFAATGGTVCH